MIGARVRVFSGSLWKLPSVLDPVQIESKNISMAWSHAMPVLTMGQRIADSKRDRSQRKADKMRMIISTE